MKKILLALLLFVTPIYAQKNEVSEKQFELNKYSRFVLFFSPNNPQSIFLVDTMGGQVWEYTNSRFGNGQFIPVNIEPNFSIPLAKRSDFSVLKK